MASVLLGTRFQGAPLVGVCEHVEATFGEAVACRDETVTLCARDGGLGPPDLVWLRKARATRLAKASVHTECSLP